MGLKLLPAGLGFSLFKFVSDHSKAESTGRATTTTLHRLCTFMRKMDLQTIVHEDVEPSDPDMIDECAALDRYFGKDIAKSAFRFTFIAKDVKTPDDLHSVEKEYFLSSAILINFQEPTSNAWHTYIYKAVVALPGKFINDKSEGRKIKRPLLNNYLHAHRTFDCNIQITVDKIFQFKIDGTYFCQQNNFTSVCAHAALSMTINNMKTTGGLISPENINKMIGIDHKRTKIDPNNKGLSQEQIESVLKQLGFTYTWWNFFQNPNDDYSDYIYRYLEGRLPVLLVFSTESLMLHVVPVLGHTLNSDMWRPEAEWAYAADPRNRIAYKSAASWTDNLIIHDDNFGMYFCLPVDALKRVTLPKYDPRFRAIWAVVITPKELTTPAYEAEWGSVVITRDFLQKAMSAGTIDEWSKRILLSDRLIVVRTMLMTKEHYSLSLDLYDFEGNTFSEREKQQLLESLPDLFWISELTLPDLYTANRTKIVDFFYRCDNPSLDNVNKVFQRWIQIRLPHVLLVRDKPSKALSITSHYPLLTFSKENETFDW